MAYAIIGEDIARRVSFTLSNILCQVYLAQASQMSNFLLGVKDILHWEISLR